MPGRPARWAKAWVRGYAADKDAIWKEVIAELQTALALDDCDSDVHRILAAVNIVSRNYERAWYHQEWALALNPNDDLIVVQLGEILTWLGQPEDGIEWIRKAMRLNPYHPERFWNHLGRAYFAAGRYSEAVEAFKRISAPDHTHHAFLAAAAAQLGDAAAAKRLCPGRPEARSGLLRDRLCRHPALSARRRPAAPSRRAAQGRAARSDKRPGRGLVGD